jgi:hypothetical protein
MFDQKGQIRIIEAFLSIALVFSAILVSTNLPTSPNLSRQQSLISIGTQALVKLDNDGTLSSLIAQQDWVIVKQALDATLPLGVSFNLTVFDEEMRQVNSQLIQNSDVMGRETVSVQHICASQTLSVRFFVLQLQLGWAR